MNSAMCELIRRPVRGFMDISIIGSGNVGMVTGAVR